MEAAILDEERNAMRVLAFVMTLFVCFFFGFITVAVMRSRSKRRSRDLTVGGCVLLLVYDVSPQDRTMFLADG